MQRHLIRLDFQSPLHIGSDEPLIGIEGVQPGIHSDTIFSGMINVWARLVPRRISGNMPKKVHRWILAVQNIFLLPVSRL